MSTAVLQWYEIGVLDYSKRVKKYNSSFDVTGASEPTIRSTEWWNLSEEERNAHKGDAGWRFRKMNGSEHVPLRVLFRQARNSTHIKRIIQNLNKRFGSVIYYNKVDTSFYFKKVEYINLKQKPLTVNIESQDEFILNAQGELTPTQKATRKELEQKYEINIEY